MDTATGVALVNTKPLSVYIVLTAFAANAPGAPEGRNATGVPAITLKVVIAVPSLLVTTTETAVVESVETINSFASDEYCQGAGAM